MGHQSWPRKTFLIATDCGHDWSWCIPGLWRQKNQTQSACVWTMRQFFIPCHLLWLLHGRKERVTQGGHRDRAPGSRQTAAPAEAAANPALPRMPVPSLSDSRAGSSCPLMTAHPLRIQVLERLEALSIDCSLQEGQDGVDSRSSSDFQNTKSTSPVGQVPHTHHLV